MSKQKQYYEGIRNQILDNSLILEDQIGYILGKVLSIDDVENSLSFGNRNFALSFNQKLYLLIDLGEFPKEFQAKFQAFMAIRNKFLHLQNVTSFVKCFSILEQEGKNILKWWENGLTDPEEKYEAAFQNLLNQVMAIASEMVDDFNAMGRDLLKARKESLKKNSLLDELLNNSGLLLLHKMVNKESPDIEGMRAIINKAYKLI